MTLRSPGNKKNTTKAVSKEAAFFCHPVSKIWFGILFESPKKIINAISSCNKSKLLLRRTFQLLNTNEASSKNC
jgi:hypothetical protein